MKLNQIDPSVNEKIKSIEEKINGIQTKKIKEAKENVDSISNSIKHMEKKLNKLAFSSEEEAVHWIESFPIETLKESCDVDRGIKNKLGLPDIDYRYKCCQEYVNLIGELEDAQRDLKIAKIDSLLVDINSLVPGEEDEI